MNDNINFMIFILKIIMLGYLIGFIICLILLFLTIFMALEPVHGIKIFGRKLRDLFKDKRLSAAVITAFSFMTIISGMVLYGKYSTQFSSLLKEYEKMKDQKWKDAQEIRESIKVQEFAENRNKQYETMEKCKSYIPKYHPEHSEIYNKPLEKGKDYYGPAIECSNLARVPVSEVEKKASELTSACMGILEKKDKNKYQTFLNNFQKDPTLQGNPEQQLYKCNTYLS